jgi:hypothetical protein
LVLRFFGLDLERNIMRIDLSALLYASTRQPLFAARGVVATSQPLAAQALQECGHEVTIVQECGVFGRGRIIWCLPSGAYVAGSDGCTDGAAVGY